MIKEKFYLYDDGYRSPGYRLASAELQHSLTLIQVEQR